MGYKVETDISSQQISLRETYLSYAWATGKRLNQIYLGSKINDRGIDASSADTLTPLMERNAVGVLTAGQRGFFGFGIMGRVLNDNWHASLAITGDSASKAGTTDDTLTVASRAHWSPSIGKAGFLHLGGWAYYEQLSDGVTSVSRSDPISTRYNDNLRIESGPLVSPQSGIGYGFEGGGVYRSAFVLAEYGNRHIRFDTRAPANFRALSVIGGIFLTGEKPNLSRRTGGWTVPQIRSAFTDGGSGAFELVARYDKYELDNLALGGQGRSVTVGLNWYLNNWARLMVNYYRWETDNRSGVYLGRDTGDTFGARASFAF
jgi:phosphate-selective porin OprO/OprP